MSTEEFVATYLRPIVYPVATQREGMAPEPEDDVMRIEVTAGDVFRLDVAFGKVDAEYFARLPENARPSESFLAELREIQRLRDELDLDSEKLAHHLLER